MPAGVSSAGSFVSFRVHAFRVYFLGQVLSNVGTWFQSLAQALLVISLTGSGLSLGAVPALQWLPTLVLGGYGGVVADRYDPRRVLAVTNGAAGLLSVVLAVVTGMGVVNQWWVYVLVLAGGLVQVFDRPAAALIPAELVPSSMLENALGLNSLVQSSARLIGPALAGLAYATLGPTWCFSINALSYAAVLVGLSRIRPRELYPRPRAGRARGQMRDGLRYAWRTPDLRVLLVCNAVIGMLAFNFMTVITGVVRLGFELGGTEVGLAHAANALGSVAGGLVAGRIAGWTIRRLDVVCLTFGLVLLANAAAPSFLVFLALGPLLGLTLSVYQVTVQASAHRQSAGPMLGRVLGLVTLGAVGTTPLGSVVVGAVMELWHPRAAFLVGAAGCLGCAAVLALRPAAPPSPVRTS